MADTGSWMSVKIMRENIIAMYAAIEPRYSDLKDALRDQQEEHPTRVFYDVGQEIGGDVLPVQEVPPLGTDQGEMVESPMIFLLRCQSRRLQQPGRSARMQRSRLPTGVPAVFERRALPLPLRRHPRKYPA